MAVSAGAPRTRAAATFPPIPLHRRLYGFGSIYGKTIRDSRLAFIIAAGLLGGLALVMGTAVGTVFPTPEARLEVNKLVTSMPASMVNLFGNATLMGPKLGTLGGYMTWKYGAVFALGTALWSILALSGTLAGEAARGQPRLRRLGAVRQAPDRAREAGRPPDDALARDGLRRGHDRRQLERVRQRAARRPDPAHRCDRLRASGSGSSPCASVASRSPSRRSSAAPARPASPGSSWSACGSPAASTSVVRSWP